MFTIHLEEVVYFLGTIIVAAAVALTGLAALVARRLRQGLRLLLQQLV